MLPITSEVRDETGIDAHLMARAGSDREEQRKIGKGDQQELESHLNGLVCRPGLTINFSLLALSVTTSSVSPKKLPIDINSLQPVILLTLYTHIQQS